MNQAVRDWPVHIDSQQDLTGSDTDHTSSRYRYAKIVIGGQAYFLKEPATADIARLAKQDTEWARYMKAFATAHPEQKVRGLDVLATNDRGGVIFEYIDAPLLTTRTTIDTVEPHTPRLSRTLWALDKFALKWGEAQPPSRLFPYEYFTKKWQEWLSGVGTYAPASSQLTAAHTLLKDYYPYMNARFQHGDLNPWSIFDDNDTWIIFDGEHSSSQKPRFNDVAYLYCRLFATLHRPELARLLLQNFITQLDMAENDFWRAFLAVITFRSIGMFFDAYNDRTTNTYYDEATELLERCLSRELSALTSA